MPRFFNTTGPCNPADHYMLPPERRIAGLSRLIADDLDFVLHAPRQFGKTTAMLAFADTLRRRGTRALYASLETARGVEETAEAEPLWLKAMAEAARYQFPSGQRPPGIDTVLEEPVGARLGTWLADWTRADTSPVVLLLDEVDVLSGPALVNFLTQLRAGFTYRPQAFPASVGLIGMRDLRDYLTRSKGGQAVNAGSPFNIKAASVTLRNFEAPEVTELYVQYTAETGRVFTPEACERVVYWSQGQPFLVNALARTILAPFRAADEAVTPGSVMPDPVTADQIDAAKDALILSRTTHLDNLGQRLREERVAHIVQAVLLGEGGIDPGTDDFQYCLDLGLLRRGPDGIEAANPIYREVLVRELTQRVQADVPRLWWPWLTPTGRLDFPALMDAFFGWWREHGDLLVSRTDAAWLEVAGQLTFLGFLQRVVNGGGQTYREYASARGRMDICVDFAGERFVVELKRVPPRHASFATVKAKGIQQLAEYLDAQGVSEGWLVIFDQREGLSWEERLWSEELTVGGRTLHLRGG